MKKKFLYTCKNCHHKQIVEIDTSRSHYEKIYCENCHSIRYVKISERYANSQHSLNRNFNTKIPAHPPQTHLDFKRIFPYDKQTRENNRKNFEENILKKIAGFFELPSLKKLLLFLSLGFVLIVAGGVILITGLHLQFSKETYLLALKKPPSNILYDRNGRILSELFDVKISTLRYSDLPEDFINILLFVEDRDFFHHYGIDISSLFRAMYVNLLAGRFEQGASTITQQLARILLNRREKTITRKLKEAFLALELESRFSKEEILTYYANHVYLGHGVYGFENASWFYFRKKLHQLNFVEKLSLACLPSRPEYYSPLRNIQHLEAKMDSIYKRMQKEKFPFLIPEKQYIKEKQNLLASLNRSPSETFFGSREDFAPHVTEWVRMKIQNLFGEDYMYSKGLKIYTTLDLDLQVSAYRETAAHIKELRKIHRYNPQDEDLKNKVTVFYLQHALGGVFFGLPVPNIPDRELQSASIGIQPQTGEILFLVGGAEFSPGNQFNRAIFMKRQTGSAIKPIIYAAGIEDGLFHPGTIFEDSPIYFPVSHMNGNYWLPENIDETFEGKITLREALARSRNIPALLAAQQIGLDRLAYQFRKFFFHHESEFRKRFKQELAIAIGILEMSPLEMAVAFSAFANNGVIKRPYLIVKIEDQQGNILYRNNEHDEFSLMPVHEKQVVTGDVAEVMVSLLQSAARYSGVSRGGFSSPRLAGKTGTTNAYRDAWFIGILPTLVASVWVGFDEPKVSMQKGTGAGVAGPLYGKILRNVKEKYDTGEYFFEPKAIYKTFCGKNGRIQKEIFPVSFATEENINCKSEPAYGEFPSPGSKDFY